MREPANVLGGRVRVAITFGPKPGDPAVGRASGFRIKHGPANARETPRDRRLIQDEIVFLASAVAARDELRKITLWICEREPKARVIKLPAESGLVQASHARSPSHD